MPLQSTYAFRQDRLYDIVLRPPSSYRRTVETFSGDESFFGNQTSLWRKYSITIRAE